MTDNHIHIGQFYDVYYDPVEIIDIVMSGGMSGLSFSSTSSCIEGIKYHDIEKEILATLAMIPYSDETVRPYLWYIPGYIEQNITLESAFSAIPYKGIKFHPFAQKWDFDNPRHRKCLNYIFDFAGQNELPVLIHTGCGGVDNPDRFEPFIKEYAGVKCILAHCRLLNRTLYMLEKYDNVYFDTAFAPEENITVAAAKYQDRMVFGTDFPITHYYKTNYPANNSNPFIALKEQYAEDINKWSGLT
jgi:predicted TIM-barrel fold metal-dependent hydrolase